jgi:hypothetical protein
MSSAAWQEIRGSVAQWRDLLFLSRFSRKHFSPYVGGCYTGPALAAEGLIPVDVAVEVMGGAANRPWLRKELYRNTTPDST